MSGSGFMIRHLKTQSQNKRVNNHPHYGDDRIREPHMCRTKWCILPSDTNTHTHKYLESAEVNKSQRLSKSGVSRENEETGGEESTWQNTDLD